MASHECFHMCFFETPECSWAVGCKQDINTLGKNELLDTTNDVLEEDVQTSTVGTFLMSRFSFLGVVSMIWSNFIATSRNDQTALKLGSCLVSGKGTPDFRYNLARSCQM